MSVAVQVKKKVGGGQRYRAAAAAAAGVAREQVRAELVQAEATASNNAIRCWPRAAEVSDATLWHTAAGWQRPCGGAAAPSACAEEGQPQGPIFGE